MQRDIMPRKEKIIVPKNIEVKQGFTVLVWCDETEKSTLIANIEDHCRMWGEAERSLADVTPAAPAPTLWKDVFAGIENFASSLNEMDALIHKYNEPKKKR